jgi:hypothetical protein
MEICHKNALKNGAKNDARWRHHRDVSEEPFLLEYFPLLIGK